LPKGSNRCAGWSGQESPHEDVPLEELLCRCGGIEAGVTVRSFFDDVIAPAIRALEEKIAALGRSDSPGDAFAQADPRDVLKETKMAFGLAIQSIWERQLRSYLRGCAEELAPGEGMVAQVTKGHWARLYELFLELRGIRLDAFPSFAELDTLQLLGNAWRHGDVKPSLLTDVV